MQDAPTFPPLLTGIPVPARTDPLQKALAAAQTGDEVEPGTIHYAENDGTFRVALTLAPEEPAGDAVRVTFAVMLGLADALGALAPPEVAVHFDWPFGVKVNGAHCGDIRVALDTRDPQAEPDWLIVAIDLAVAIEPGRVPGVQLDRTTLHDEGCGEITVPALIESWARHSLVWIRRYLDDGIDPVLAAWKVKCDGVGEEVPTAGGGTFMGLDPNGGMLLRNGSETRLITLHETVERNP